MGGGFLRVVSSGFEVVRAVQLEAKALSCAAVLDQDACWDKDDDFRGNLLVKTCFLEMHRVSSWYEFLRQIRDVGKRQPLRSA